MDGGGGGGGGTIDDCCQGCVAGCAASARGGVVSPETGERWNQVHAAVDVAVQTGEYTAEVYICINNNNKNKQTNSNKQTKNPNKQTNKQKPQLI